MLSQERKDIGCHWHSYMPSGCLNPYQRWPEVIPYRSPHRNPRSNNSMSLYNIDRIGPLTHNGHQNSSLKSPTSFAWVSVVIGQFYSSLHVVCLGWLENLGSTSSKWNICMPHMPGRIWPPGLKQTHNVTPNQTPLSAVEFIDKVSSVSSYCTRSTMQIELFAYPSLVYIQYPFVVQIYYLYIF